MTVERSPKDADHIAEHVLSEIRQLITAAAAEITDVHVHVTPGASPAAAPTNEAQEVHAALQLALHAVQPPLHWKLHLMPSSGLPTPVVRQGHLNVLVCMTSGTEKESLRQLEVACSMGFAIIVDTATPIGPDNRNHTQFTMHTTLTLDHDRRRAFATYPPFSYVLLTSNRRKSDSERLPSVLEMQMEEKDLSRIFDLMDECWKAHHDLLAANRPQAEVEAYDQEARRTVERGSGHNRSAPKAKDGGAMEPFGNGPYQTAGQTNGQHVPSAFAGMSVMTSKNSVMPSKNWQDGRDFVRSVSSSVFEVSVLTITSLLGLL